MSIKRGTSEWTFQQTLDRLLDAGCEALCDTLIVCRIPINGAKKVLFRVGMGVGLQLCKRA
jgi:hypothetical protein